MNENESVDFRELPHALVEEVLKRSAEVGGELLQSFSELREKNEEWRNKLIDLGMINSDSSLQKVDSPTTCGIDGSFAVEKLMSTDLAVAGALAVEGLIPPSEKRHWSDPWPFVYIETVVHHPDTSSILRAGTLGTELVFAQQAPHELVLLDGSFTTPLIALNQGFLRALKFPHRKMVRDLLIDKGKSFLEAYHYVIAPPRADRQWAAVPKYTTNREIGEKLKGAEDYEDRGLMSVLLDAGEYTSPVPLKSDPNWHINVSVFSKFTNDMEYQEIEKLRDQVIKSLGDIKIFYYKPRAYMPALRIEISRAIAENPTRLSFVLQGIKDQCGTGAIMEPYPLYLADRMVKHLPQAVPGIRHIISQHLAESYEGNISDIFLGLHSYRTESGR